MIKNVKMRAPWGSINCILLTERPGAEPFYLYSFYNIYAVRAYGTGDKSFFSLKSALNYYYSQVALYNKEKS